MSLKNIVNGWGKSLGYFDVTEEEKKMSRDRLAICATCPFARESTFLKIVRSEAVEMAAIYCVKCGCPTNQKSLIKNEHCPEGKW